MKAMTLPPENAALVAAGVQTIITTARRPRLAAGDRLAIHAGTRLQPPGTWIGVTPTKFGPRIEAVVDRGCLFRGDQCIPPYPGHIVASAVVRDVVPISAPKSVADWAHLPDGETATILSANNDTANSRWRLAVVDFTNHSGWTREDDLTNQLPYADFTPGRWAVLLDDVAPTTDRCPACWGSGLRKHDDGDWWICPACRKKHSRSIDVGAGTCSPIPQRGGPGVWRWEP